ncbi:uncharacterized protein LOC131887057 [Tigriopus californicus]|uniref:uncharacterized protein LOC131887057 n=1 Tax=Tigriopus californicus TaxID=6832 RepID=UPI0027D9E6B9|nr:uncharacterized protein LOC131887057 [Tigriopus californicus]XP_059091532.1 uncharacterized protein LOC131887057 [Tigriopus californicus]XP_059091533.1 uncharacterized protein LOC131887057 [Tigriopus californicus]XP_059091534.1 uncharacterized protein LOC131887057 [Tigriopus californicus]XP_059091535.1 uncharacterized protein LOC131887057 [Tigriopus californicus]|eukprot:TCALIF_02435-PA protein Name:"Protein of unknown function" AED:0.09 eAED:0.09 QI:0/-1/0/1/-1/1/1/0/374
MKVKLLFLDPLAGKFMIAWIILVHVFGTGGSNEASSVFLRSPRTMQSQGGWTKDGSGEKDDRLPENPSEPLAVRSNGSSLTKFLHEPQLGTSWYNPNGPTPTFFPDQKNGTVYHTRLGAEVLLNCKVTSLERDLVSWIRKDEGLMPVVLTVGFRPHSSENRFILDFQPPNNYRLRIQNVQWHDEGRYLCQLSVYPPSLMWSRLELIRPIVHLLDGDHKPVTALHYESGSTIEIVCRVRRPPYYQASLVWEATTGMATTDDQIHILNRDTTRGGVKIDTGRDEETGFLVSVLYLDNAQPSDTGNYTCRLRHLPDNARQRYGLSDTISVHVLKAENTEAIYSQSSPGKGSIWTWIIVLTAYSSGNSPWIGWLGNPG